MTKESLNPIFTPDVLENLFPEERTDQFFDALFGNSSEGAYNISLKFRGNSHNRLEFEFHLSQRPGKCLACNLTYGLPQVFSRHPVINVKKLVQDIDSLLDGKAKCSDWQIGTTRKISGKLYVIPLVVLLEY